MNNIIESGLGESASFNIYIDDNGSGSNKFAVECDICFSAIGDRFNRSVFIQHYESVESACKKIKKDFLNIVGTYLTNVSDPKESVLVHAHMIASKIDYELANDVKNVLIKVTEERMAYMRNED